MTNDRLLFIKDLEGSTPTQHIGSNISNLNAGTVDAWKIVYEAANANSKFSDNYRRDMIALQQIKKMIAPNNAAMLTRLGEQVGLTEIIQKSYNAPCYTCSTTGIERSNMSDYLKHVEYFAQNYGSITSSSSVIGGQGMKSANLWQVNATAHMVRFMYDDKGISFSPTSFEQSYTNPNPFPNCRVDAQIGTDPNKTVCEFKSWGTKGDEQNDEDKFDSGNYTSFNRYKSMFWNLGLGYASTGQFRCYLQQIPSMGNLRYYFDAKRAGVDETYVKNTFKQMMYNPNGVDVNGNPDRLTPNGKLVFEAIWGNTRGLKASLFTGINFSDPDAIIKPIGLRQFAERIAAISDTFYKFIKVE